jgi:hypothetical protein
MGERSGGGAGNEKADDILRSYNTRSKVTRMSIGGESAHRLPLGFLSRENWLHRSFRDSHPCILVAIALRYSPRCFRT